eukprot:979450-Pyramimonas_sp.AAC.1
MVQKGRTKSWWSMCGGMQSSSEYRLTMAESGSWLAGRMPHRSSRRIRLTSRGGRGSTVSSVRMPGGRPCA